MSSRASYIEIPGSGRVRVTTASDVRRAIDASTPAPAPSRSLAVISRPGRTLTASASRAPASPGALLRLDQNWQRQAMRIYETQGECSNPAQYQARAMERIRYYPAVLNAKGVPEESTDPELLALFNRMRVPGGAPGDLAELAGSYARLQFVIGDGLLTASKEDGEEVWEYLSPMEMRMQPRADPKRRQEYKRLRAPGIPPEDLTEASDGDFSAEGLVNVWRLWRKDIEFSQRAYSPVKPIRDDYELLARLTLAVAAEASSRAAQRGLLFLPDELSFGPADPTMEENPDEDPLIRELQESMARAIRNPGSAEAMAPFVMRAPGVTQTSGGAVPTADLIKWIQLGPGDRYAEGEMWDKTIARIAGSVDMPQELMTGVGGVSHWCVDDETEILTARGWRKHQDVNAGDEVLTLNHETGLSEWGPVRDIARFNVEDEPMLSMEGRCHSSLTTLNHRWPSVSCSTGRRRWRFSNTLSSADRIPTGARCADLPTKPIHSDSLVALAAWIWTEGSIRYRQGRRHPIVRIHQSHTANPGNCARIRSALADLYGPAHEGPLESSRRRSRLNEPAWNERQRGEKTEFALNIAAAEPLVKIAPRRIVALDFIRELTAEQLELFIETSVRADGSWRGTTQRIVFQKDSSALAAFELAAILLGKSVAHLSRMIKGFGEGLHELHRISVHTRDHFTPVGQRRETVPYTGTIWCPVTDNQTWLARRNGKIFYTGNTSWFLGAEGFTEHTGPTLTRFCNDLGSAYLRPAAKDAGIANADRVTVWYDASAAVNHPDETGTALKAHDQLIVSDAYAREKIGATESAKPDDKELARRVAIKLKEFPSDLEPAPQQGETPPSKGGTGADVVQGPPAESTRRAPGNKPPSPQGPSLSAMIAGAAVMQVDRARELAGNRLVRRAQSCDECADKIKNVKPALVAAALGCEQVRSVIDGHASEASLVAGVGTAFADRLVAWGVNGGWPQQLGQMVEQHALRTLYETDVPPLPPGFLAACQRAAE